MDIVDLIPSPKSDKRFRIFLQMGEGGRLRHWDFGSPTGYTYIDGADDTVRRNFRTRHTARRTERERIEQFIPSAAMFSYWVLWGDSHDITDNLVSLQKHL